VLEPSAGLFCSIADRHPGAAAILDDIDIQSRAARHTWVEPLDIPQPPGAHWMTREGTIFRS